MLLLVHRQARYVEYVSCVYRVALQVLMKCSPALIVGNFLPITEAASGPLSSP